MVREHSSITDNAQVDREGHRIVVGGASAYDLFLSRNIAKAKIVRAENSQEVLACFLRDGYEVAAGVKQQLEADAKNIPNLRMLPGRFMQIAQAMGVPRNKGPAAAQALAQFVEKQKSSGFVAQSLARHGIQGAQVAPLA